MNSNVAQANLVAMGEHGALPDRARTTDDPVLSVKNLSVDFATEGGTVTVIRDVSLDLRRGRTTGLVGESGSGKTVTALSIMGLLPAIARVAGGTASLDGVDLFNEPRRSLQRLRGSKIAMIFQEARRSLDPCFVIGEQVAEVIRAHQDVSRKQAFTMAIELLDRVRIPEPQRRAHAYPHQLSGGQCQRVMLATAIACEPIVLLADEPTTALDVTVQSAMFDLLSGLQRELDLAILLVTHDLGVVAETCNDVAVMYAGEIVEQAPVHDLFASPSHPYTRGLLSAARIRSGEGLSSIPGTVPVPGRWPDGCRFHPRCTFAADVCKAHDPVLRDIGGQRSVRCTRFEEIGGGIGGSA